MQRSITYLPVKAKDDVTHLRVDVYYSQGGYNLSTYQEEQRGYYLSVSPVSRSKLGDANTERYLAFSGRKRLLLPVNRNRPSAMKQRCNWRRRCGRFALTRRRGA